MSEGSPVKGISIREDRFQQKTLHIKTDENRYKSISDFYFDIKAFVKFADKDLTLYNGYILTVHRKDGVPLFCPMIRNHLCYAITTTKLNMKGISFFYSSYISPVLF